MTADKKLEQGSPKAHMKAPLKPKMQAKTSMIEADLPPMDLRPQTEEQHTASTFKDARAYARNPEKASDIIRNRLFDHGASFFANDTIHHFIKEGELDGLKKEVAEKWEELMRILLIDIEHDHNTKETSERVARMWIDEVMKGRYHAPPKATTFPNAKKLNEIYSVGPITVRSMCSHHFVPILGRCWVGVIPGSKVVGLSKFNRSIDWIMSRPQIQEEAAVQVADMLEKALEPIGVAVVIDADHMCMSWRGVKEHDCSMANSVVRGVFAQNPSAKKEFFDIIKGQGYGSKH